MSRPRAAFLAWALWAPFLVTARAVVREAMQPAHVSLWLREAGR